MPSLIIEGNNPLNGAVTLSGAKNSAIKLMFASMYSNEDVILDNVPNVSAINGDIELIKSIGGKAEWIGSNRLLLNGADIKTYEIPYDIGSRFRTTLLLAGPLLYRFGKAVLPRVGLAIFKTSPINRLLSVWENLGITVDTTETHILLSSEMMHPGNINFKTASHMGTDNAILSAMMIEGETTIYNASEEPEIEDLIQFANLTGSHVKRTEPRKIVVNGTKIFKGASFDVQSDKSEAVMFATLAIMTNGNIIIQKIVKESMVQFVNFLTKIGANYEFNRDELKIWRNQNALLPANVQIVASPGFVPDWEPYVILLLTKASGTSLVHDTVYIDHHDYIKDLNILGADIELVKPTSVGLVPVISDDSYDYQVKGEPLTVAKIQGPSNLKGKKIQMSDSRYSSFYITAGLCAEGKTEIVDFENRYESFDNTMNKLESLGARFYI
jgi:UDP-N-acetylglucosamine 1-carboxyvinyltransferase